MPDHSFHPPLPLRNPHLQTILASTRPRRLLVAARARALVAASREEVLDCGQGVRLLGLFSGGPGRRRGLAILLHGWEGSANSSYLLSAAATLFEAGFDVFRLNLRDHGDSHGLNREIFNSARLDEVRGALAAILERHRLRPAFMAGFSLGGNFVLRLGLSAAAAPLELTALAAVCPLIDPAATTWRLEADLPLYHHYFVHKWQRSLRRKLQLHPGLDDTKALLRCRSLSAMHRYFVPRHTPYATPEDYFAAYTVTAAMLAAVTLPCHIIAAADDPITTRGDLDAVGRPPSVTFHHTRHGGHCGFLRDLALHSWVDDELRGIFAGYCPGPT